MTDALRPKRVSRSHTTVSGNALLLTLASLPLILLAVAFLLWWRYGAAIFTEMVLAAVSVCF